MTWDTCIDQQLAMLKMKVVLVLVSHTNYFFKPACSGLGRKSRIGRTDLTGRKGVPGH